MAKPRVFISSTFYDLRQVREDLERTIKELAYEPVRHEKGAIPYSKDEPLESAAYREVELSDVIVAIVGGRFGTESQDGSGYSISQNELRRALEKGKQVFIFVEKAVLAELHTFRLNRENSTVRYSSVDDLRIFEFLDDVFKLPLNNAIKDFETGLDISSYLKDQFAGLFHRFLQSGRRSKEIEVLDEMRRVSQTIKEVVTFLTTERDKSREEAFRSILLANHPAFKRLAELTGTTYRVFFTNREERDAWFSARSWKPGSDPFDEDSIEEWFSTNDKVKYWIKFRVNLFNDDNTLKVFTEESWEGSWIDKVLISERAVQQDAVSDDDIPF